MGGTVWILNELHETMSNVLLLTEWWPGCGAPRSSECGVGGEAVNEHRGVISQKSIQVPVPCPLGNFYF